MAWPLQWHTQPDLTGLGWRDTRCYRFPRIFIVLANTTLQYPASCGPVAVPQATTCLPPSDNTWSHLSVYLLSSFSACLPPLFFSSYHLSPLPAELSLCRLQMENICSLECCKTHFHDFPWRLPCVSRHPGLISSSFLANACLFHPGQVWLSLQGPFPLPCSQPGLVLSDLWAF